MEKPLKMQVSGCFLLLFSSLLFSFSTLSFALSEAEASLIARRQLLAIRENGFHTNTFNFKVDDDTTFDNTRLKKAHVALQAWKKAVYSDPFNTTANWVGTDVCSYNGVFCAPALDDKNVNVVAGIDLNHADIAGYLPPELGLLTDVALFHINSNRFCGIIPRSMSDLKIMHEFDVSNNRFVGPFPDVVLSWPSVKFIDIRFNNFEGLLPPQIFERDLDALFLNNNRFRSSIPDTIGKSTVSVVTFANNKFSGCIPRTIGKMLNLNEILFINNELGGCFPGEIGSLST